MSLRLLPNAHALRALLLPALALCALACSNDTSSSSDVDGGKTTDSGTTDGGTRSDGATGSTPDASVIVDKITNPGADCDMAADCEGKGPTRCLTTVAGYTFPGGYCTTSCTDDSECSDGARCPLAAALQSPLLALLGDVATQVRDFSNCFQTCQRDRDCRTADGYTCASVGEILPMGAASFGVDVATKFCLPPAPEMPDAGGMVITDASVDAGPVDAGSDAAVDGGGDAGALDAGAFDAGSDAGTDAAVVGSDAGADAAEAPGSDGGLDAGDTAA